MPCHRCSGALDAAAPVPSGPILTFAPALGQVVRKCQNLFGPLALQLHFFLEMSPFGGGLVSAPPARPRDDVCWLDLAHRKFVGDAADFLHGPPDQILMFGTRGLFGGVTSLAR